MLHVLNGDAAADQLAPAGLPGRLTVWADTLCEGPLDSGTDRTRFRRRRAEFHALLGHESEEACLAHLEQFDEGLATAAGHEEAVLWFEHDLFDQVLLVHHLAWWPVFAPASTRLSLVCIDAFPGVLPFHGLGQLSPTQLATLFPVRLPVTPDQRELAGRAWSAFTADNPAGLVRLLTSDTSPLPHLGAAVRRYLEDYPAVRTGLSRTETMILEALGDASLSPTALFRAVQRREERVFMGDTSFWDRVGTLAGGDAPLVELSRGPALPGALPDGTVRRTSLGERVLAGREDWVSLAGVNRWHGGVHLEGRTVPWRWDPHRGTLVRG